MKDIIKNIKGTKDILPDESFIWQYVESEIRSFLNQYGYNEIRTPAFENSVLFNRSIGEDTDIVSKEMYSWVDQGNNNLTLKPEVTASVVRAYIQHNLGRLNSLNKVYYIDSLFRRERPQKGRFRQFEQFGVESIGSEFPEQDSEIISLAYNFYKKMNVKKLNLEVNSIGSKDVRDKYKKALIKYLSPHKNSLSKISQKRLETNPLRILDTKIDFEKDIIQDGPIIIDYLSKEDREHFNTVLSYLDKLKINYKVNNFLVRGLDYYSRTVFEICTDTLGAQSALCGGGRYDYLIEGLGGEKTPAIGFAAGIERLLLAMQIDSKKIKKNPDVYVVTIGENAINYSLPIIDILRAKCGLIIHTDMLRRSLKAQMKDANKLKAKYSIIIGENEITNNEVIIKNMDSGDQTKQSTDQISHFFK